MPDERSLSVEVAETDDSRQLVETLVLAFGTDPLMRWAFPAAAAYRRRFPEFIDHYAGPAFEAGTAYHVRDGAGVALWLPPGTEPDEVGLADLLDSALSADDLEAAWTAFDRVQRSFPDEPRWHLPFVGVDPLHQGNGYGSALLEHALERIDRDGAVATLETANPRTLSLYLRHGFELLEPIRVGSMPPIFPMVRESRS